MKIHSIVIHNLHSLTSQKPLIIAFDENPLQGCGLFAITGPTGAGKTTILDAITLALYGENARDSSPKRDIMSYGAGECSAEVVFETAAGTFKARWSLHRARKKADGEIQNPTRELATFPEGNILATKVEEVKSTVEAIVGLNKEQFLKSVLLAQGQFMAFLSAGDGDRSALLEKLTGTGIYRQLSTTCYEKNKAEKDRLEVLQNETAGIVLLSGEEKKELADRKHEIESLSGKHRLEIAQLDTERNWHQRLSLLQVEEAQAQQHLQKATAEKSRNADLFHRWERHCQALPVAALLQQWQGKETERHTLERDTVRICDEVKKSAGALTEKEAALTKCTNQKKAAEKQWQDAEPGLLQALQQEEEARQLAKNILREAEVLEKQKEKQTRVQKGGDEIAEKLRFLQVGKTENADWLLQHNGDSRLAPIIEEAAEKQIRISNLRTEMQGSKTAIKQSEERRKELALHLLQLRDSYKSATEALAFREKRQLDINSEKGLWKNALQKRQHDLQGEKQRLSADLETTEHSVQAIAFYLEHHQKLQAGKPCDLCGSPEHPYSDRDLSGMQTTLQQQQTGITALRGQLTKIETAAASYEQMLYSLEGVETTEGTAPAGIETPQEAQRLLQTLLREEEELKGNIIRIRRDVESGSGQIGEMAGALHKEELTLAQLQSDAQELLNEGGRLSQYFQLTASNLGTECCRNGEEAFVKSLRQRAEVYQQKSLSAQADTVRIEDLTIQLQGLRQECEEMSTITAQAEAGLSKLQEERENLLLAIAQSYPADFESVALFYNHLKAAAQIAEKAWQQAQQEHAAAVQQKALADQASQNHETLWKRLQEESEALTCRLQEELRTASLPEEFSTVIARLIPDAEAKTVNEKVQSLSNTCIQAEALLSGKIAELEAHRQNELQVRPLDFLEANRAALQQSLEALQQELGRIDQVLAINQEKEAQLSGKLHELRRQQAEAERWRVLNDQIGAADGDKFARFAQTLTLEMVLSHANEHLNLLSDRYRLRRRGSNARDLGILVEDLHLGGTLRETTSLSGGETFLVSLGLALGLSDMASQKTRIDSLFIDEGFGSLDADALEDAITTLENLQARGKTIGIISHVEQLKDRIATQIVVRKHGNGVSSLEVVP